MQIFIMKMFKTLGFWCESHCTRADLGFFFLLELEPVMTSRYFVGKIRYSFEN